MKPTRQNYTKKFSRASNKKRPASQARPARQVQAAKTARWEKRPAGETDAQPTQTAPSQETQSTQPTPAQMSESERRYLELQAAFVTLGQKTIASRPAKDQAPTASAAAAPPSASVEPAAHDTGVTTDTTDAAHTPMTSMADQIRQKLCDKVEAQTMADMRPTAPPTPVAPNPKEVTPDTGELSSSTTNQPMVAEQKQQSEVQKPPSPVVEITVGTSPTRSPARSPDTLATDTVVVSSPDPEPTEDITKMDLVTLQARQYVAMEEVQQLTGQLFRAQSNLWRITKRIKTTQENQDSTAPPAEGAIDMEMEKID